MRLSVLIANYNTKNAKRRLEVWCPGCSGKGFTTNFIGQGMKCLLCQGKGYLDDQKEESK